MVVVVSGSRTLAQPPKILHGVAWHSVVLPTLAQPPTPKFTAAGKLKQDIDQHRPRFQLSISLFCRMNHCILSALPWQNISESEKMWRENYRELK